VERNSDSSRHDTDATPSSLVVPAGGGVLSYLEAGSGPPLVLLHGIGSAAVSFCHQLDGLSADFRCNCVGCAGLWGSTPLATSEPDPGGYAAALKCFLDALALDRIHLLGHSLGTLIAARFTAERPERVITLTLSASPAVMAVCRQPSSGGHSRRGSTMSRSSDRAAVRDGPVPAPAGSVAVAYSVRGFRPASSFARRSYALASSSTRARSRGRASAPAIPLR
jgi:pimeloyl-ACP methyl ester carboxylesterase